MPAVEWQCTCGKWVPLGYSRCTHITPRQPAFADLHAMRIAQEAGLSGVAPVTETFDVTHVLRTKDMPTR